jgi:hypothetical protein
MKVRPRRCDGGCWRQVVEPGTKAERHLRRRERKEHFGEMVQMDGSFHAWLERGEGMFDRPGG